MGFKIGEKVVCINDINQYNETLKIRGGCVVKNDMYVIRSFSSIMGIRLVEVFGGFYCDFEECGFNPNRFRKVDYKFVEEVIRNLKEETMYYELF